MPDLKTRVLRKMFLEPVLDRMDMREERVLQSDGAFRFNEQSPSRFHIMREALKRGAFDSKRLKSPMMMRSLVGIFKTFRDLKRNKAVHNTLIDDRDLADLRGYLISMGITSIGFTKVPARWVFKDKAVMYSNAIVTTMEMDKARIATAPSPEAGRAVHEIYCYQGLAMIKGARFLRRRGYAAHAGHPLMGLALYPPLAQAAGLGQLGASGLFITPERGPRVRLAAIFTDIENLPFAEESTEHQWILDYCSSCRICAKKCPQDAILAAPTQHSKGQITCVDTDRCFPYFMEKDGCSICIKVCPFNMSDYETIKKAYFEEHSVGST